MSVFGNVPVCIPSGKQQSIAVNVPSVSITVNQIQVQGTGSVFSFFFSTPPAAIPRGASSAVGFGGIAVIMPTKFGFDFGFGSVPIIIPAGLRI